MKKIVTLFVLLYFSTQWISAQSFSLGGETITKIVDLPNNKDYMLNDLYVDIGIVYKQFKIIAVPILNYDKRWCLFSGSTYWECEKAEIDEIASGIGITLSRGMELPFWDAWGGKLLLLGILTVCSLLYLREKNKDEQVVKCPSCGAEIRLKKESEDLKIKCKKCNKEYEAPLVMSIQEYNIPMFPGKKLFPRHTVLNSSEGKPVTGEVINSKDDPTSLALKNLMSTSWYIKASDGNLIEIPSKSEVIISAGTVIDFTGGVKGEIK
jgi:hypothetical protein